VELCEKKQKRCQAAEHAEAGDMWDHTAIAADSKLMVSLVVGKRTHEQTRALVHDTKKRLRPGHLPAIFTDAYEGYETAILDAFGRRYPAPPHDAAGRSRRPVLRWPQGLAYGQVNKHYTSVVEGHNGTSRLRNQRKVWRTLAFSKATRYHRWMSWLAVGLYNFCRAHSSLKIRHEAYVSHRSPAMAAKLTDHIWLTREWLLCPVLGR